MHYAVCDYALDIAQNAVEAGAREVLVDLDEGEAGVRVLVEDDGVGMTAEERERALDPFYTDGKKHSGRRVGLGLPFLVQAVEQAGGDWNIESEKGRGSSVSFSFPRANIDSPPLGDLRAFCLSALCLLGEHEMVIRRKRSGEEDYELRRSELAEALGGLDRAPSLSLLRDFIDSQENDDRKEIERWQR